MSTLSPVILGLTGRNRTACRFVHAFHSVSRPLWKYSRTLLDYRWDGPAEHDSHTFRFQTEVERLMDILIHSVYSDKDVFLRELMSNASDALNRLRIRQIMQPASQAASLQITIEIDKTARTIKIRDNGVGMTRLELIQNLGTVARSGTSRTVEALQVKAYPLQILHGQLSTQ